MKDEPKAGWYLHYKGKRYRVYGVAVLSGTEDHPSPHREGDRVVVYKPGYYREDGSPPLLTFRTVEEWCEEVEWPDGERRPRFLFQTEAQEPL